MPAANMLPRKRARNSWTDSQRRVLVLLVARTSLDWELKVCIFNCIFREEMYECGLYSGIGEPALRAQWYDLHGQGVHRLHRLDSVGEEVERTSVAEGRIDEALEACLAGTDDGSTIVVKSTDPGIPSVKSGTKAVSAIPAKRIRSEDNDNDQVHTKRPKIMRPRATVRVFGSEQDLTPSTPAKQRPGAMVLHTQRTGTSHWITPLEKAEMDAPVKVIPEHVLHPPLQGLLFRWWNEDSNGINQPDGFVAGEFKYNNIPPEEPPTQEHMPWTKFESHVGRHPGKPTPFISTSNQVFRVLRIAALERLEVKKDGRRVDPGHISIIDASALNREAVFHAKTMFNVAGKKWRCWEDGVFRYGAHHEFLVWAEIPYHAIVHTFKVADFKKIAAGFMPLNEIRGPIAKVRAELKGRKTPVDKAAAMDVAQIVHFFGLRESSPIEHLQHMVTDIVRGWEFVTLNLDPESWLDLADSFAAELYRCEDPVRSYTDLAHNFRNGTWHKLRAAFLYGVRGSRGHLETLVVPEHGVQLVKRARRIGLEDPVAILQDEAYCTLRGVLRHDGRQRELSGLEMVHYDQYQSDVIVVGQEGVQAARQREVQHSCRPTRIGEPADSRSRAAHQVPRSARKEIRAEDGLEPAQDRNIDGTEDSDEAEDSDDADNFDDPEKWMM